MHSTVRIMNKAEGTLVIFGLLLLLNAAIFKLSGFNLLYPLSDKVGSFVVGANTCFILAIVISIFDKSERK